MIFVYILIGLFVITVVVCFGGMAFVNHSDKKDKARREAGMRLDANQGNQDDELIELISIAKRCFAPRYPGEISGYVHNNKLHLEFEEYDESYSDTFRTLMTRQATHTFTTYDFALKYYSVTERQANLFQQMGSQINDTWTIDINKRVSYATTSAIKAIIEQKDPGVETYLNISETSLFFRFKPE